MKLLFAEDERSLYRAVVLHILEKNCYSIDAVYDGETALEYLENGDYDGVILDIMMPKLDGISVLKTLRSRGNQVPVLMLTAKAEIDDKVLGLDTGANDYLTKPFDTKELLARIRAMTRGRQAVDSLPAPDLEMAGFYNGLLNTDMSVGIFWLFAYSSIIPPIFTILPVPLESSELTMFAKATCSFGSKDIDLRNSISKLNATCRKRLLY